MRCWLLLTGRKEALPLTILSRCQLLPFQPLAPQHIASILSQQGVDDETARAAASLVEGSLDAFSETEPAQILAKRQAAYTLLSDALGAKDSSLFQQGETVCWPTGTVRRVVALA